MIALTGRIADLLAGATHITNCKYIKWKPVHTIAPRLLPSSKIPVGWFQSHIWIEGELGLQSLDPSLVAPSIEDAEIIPIFVVTAITTTGGTKTFTFTGFIIAGVDKDLGGDEPVFVYHFLAYSVAEA